ncbi:hypothetical protein C8R43DRAFT_962145 [Mycena crocata]|nr:hypothetical protein C8R43DRAFT_962145 [Mycena crocata]
MRFLLGSHLLLSILIATALADTVVVDDGTVCKQPGTFLAAYQNKKCECQSAPFIQQEAGTACAKVAPANSNPTCLIHPVAFNYRNSTAHNDGKGGCSTGSTNPNPPPNGVVEPCPPPKSISYSNPNGPCGCESSMNLANKRRPGAIECLPPPANGKATCKNVAPGSKCTVKCDDGYAPSTDEKSCISVAKNTTISELSCGADAGSVGFLSADPVLGCVCKDTLDPATFCGVSTGDPDAEMMCSDTTDLSGKREVKCAVQCTGSFTPKDAHTCEVVVVEGDSVTLAGTTTPRESLETSCKDKVFSLPGKGGCKCAASPPAGATECVAGTNEYPVCQYTKGSGDEAECGTSKFYKKGASL